ncbi:MAG: poly-gamma-glutamate synthase PgsB [Polyangiaceae bacterium]
MALGAAAISLSIVTGLLVGAGALERVVHRRNLARIPVRVHVNGTRGKSSVTRLIAGALREHGTVTCAKTTGTLARFLLPDGRELPIFRPSGPNVIEQRRIVSVAAAHDAKALVIECMALQPELQALSELELVRATHGVITNARPDHLDVMGPTDRDVALALASMIPLRGKLFTAEKKQLEVFREACKDRKTELVAIDDADLTSVSDEDLAGFSYTEHRENVALALRVAEDLGVERGLALSGMQKSRPDPGALREYDLDFFGRRLVFVNGFAANDPVSTEQLWDLSIGRHPELKARIALFNCREDRPERSLQLGEALPKMSPADVVVVMGTGTYLFARAAVRAGLDPSKLEIAEGLGDDEIFERVVSLVDESALVFGMGNIGGHGLSLTRYFANRAHPKSTDPRSRAA